jgi:hypothetical protein
LPSTLFAQLEAVRIARSQLVQRWQRAAAAAVEKAPQR